MNDQNGEFDQLNDQVIAAKQPSESVKKSEHGINDVLPTTQVKNSKTGSKKFKNFMDLEKMGKQTI